MLPTSDPHLSPPRCQPYPIHTRAHARAHARAHTYPPRCCCLRLMAPLGFALGPGCCSRGELVSGPISVCGRSPRRALARRPRVFGISDLRAPRPHLITATGAVGVAQVMCFDSYPGMKVAFTLGRSIDSTWRGMWETCF